MPSNRDWEQMLKIGLEMKGMSQKFIDFAHMNGAGQGGEGEEDLEELPASDTEDTLDAPEEKPSRMLGKPKPMEDEESPEDAVEDEVEDKKKKGRNPKAAILISLMKKRGKK